MINRSRLFALVAWELCVLVSFVCMLAWIRPHMWSSDELVWIGELTICGVIVVALIAALSRRVGKIGGAIIGLLCGLLPSSALLAWVFVARPGFESSAGGAGLAYTLAIPSAAGGTLAGIISSVPKRSA